MFSAKANEAQIITSASISVSLINTDIDYTNNLSGLFGNYNNRRSDDIQSRSGSIVSPNSKTSDIYSVTESCKF
jgi:hypothetical protein